MSAESIDYILKSPLGAVLSKGFADLYEKQPPFPVGHLGNWLKNYSCCQKRKAELEGSKEDKQKQYNQLLKQVQLKKEEHQYNVKRRQQQEDSIEVDFNQTVSKTKFLEDLLTQYLPETLEANCSKKGNALAGCYVGSLCYRKKKLEENNFEPNAENDIQNPKVIQYIGASKSNQWMMGKILPNESGRSYQAFSLLNEEPVEEGEEGQPKEPKKKYIYVPQVQKDDKMFYFKFPRLGCYACFPMRIDSCLNSEAFDKGIVDYREFVKVKEETEKEYNEKLTEARGLFEEAKRKWEDFEVNEEEPATITDKAALQEESNKAEEVLKQITDSPPVIENVKYQTVAKQFVICCDTLGKDTQMCDKIQNYILEKVNFFKQQWEQKDRNMLLDDILLYIEEDPTLEALDSNFKEQEKNIISSNEGEIKEKHPREKESEYELTLLKCKKLISVLQETQYANSMKAYVTYNTPKYQEIIQIALMLLAEDKQKINKPLTNCLDSRKCITQPFLENLLVKLDEYELRRESSESVGVEYKINKLLERLEKVDVEALAKYNSWLSGLLTVLKNLCWCRIQCRDAKIEAHEAKLKEQVDREEAIKKFEEQLQAQLTEAKNELQEEQEKEKFSEEDWKKQYFERKGEKPEPLVVEQLLKFQDIE